MQLVDLHLKREKPLNIGWMMSDVLVMRETSLNVVIPKCTTAAEEKELVFSVLWVCECISTNISVCI